MIINLYKSSFVSSCKYGEDVVGYIEILLVLDLRSGFYFTVKVPDKSFCFRNPFKALILCLESQTIAAGKYARLKEMQTIKGDNYGN